MAITASIYHLTHYKYDNPVRLGPQIIRLKPASHSKTRVLSHSLKVTPSNHFVNLQQDPYGNYLARFVFPDPVTELKIEVDLVADMTVYNPFDFFVEEEATQWPFDYPETIREDLSIYRKPEEPGSRLKAFLATLDRSKQKTVDMIVGLNGRPGEERRRTCLIFGSGLQQANPTTKNDWIFQTGGGYFFSPAISAIRDVLAK